MSKKKLSIHDIAKELNVSITTISFILNGKAKEKRISEDMEKRVLKFVEEVGYRPNELAKSLRTGKTKIIGLMVEDIANPFFAHIARLIEENAYNKGYKIVYCSTENDVLKTRELLKVFKERQVDGYIITPPEGSEEDIRSLLDEKVPLVLFDRYFPSLPTNYVVVDNFRGAYDATVHLIQRGYRNIAFITITSGQTQMQERLEGYRRALREYNYPEFVKKIPSDKDPEKIIQAIVSFLKEEKELDAVFFATNYLGVSGLEAIKRLNLEIPRTGVVAFDDHDLFRLYSPSITAIAQPIQQISEDLIHNLLQQLMSDQAPDKKPEGVVLPVTLLERESSAGVETLSG